MKILGISGSNKNLADSDDGYVEKYVRFSL